MQTPLKAARKLIVALIGFPLLALGIILIPVPGPGLLVCFLALLILSTEFSWADSLRGKAWDKIKEIFEQSKAMQAQSAKTKDQPNNLQKNKSKSDNTDI